MTWYGLSTPSSWKRRPARSAVTMYAARLGRRMSSTSRGLKVGSSTSETAGPRKWASCSLSAVNSVR